MANFSKLARRNLPPPPTEAEAPDNLQAPETAPEPGADGRSLRATGRTKQLATRVREDFHEELRSLCRDASAQAGRGAGAGFRGSESEEPVEK